MRLATNPLVPLRLKFNFWRGHKLNLGLTVSSLEKLRSDFVQRSRQAHSQPNANHNAIKNQTVLPSPTIPQKVRYC